VIDKHRSNRVIKADAYFFDIDGTLLVTRDLVHYNALHQAMLEVYGIDTNIDGVPYHGKTDVAILRAALARCGVSASVFERQLTAALANVCREVAANAQRMVPEVCAGVPEVLSHIQAQGTLLGIASGNLESVGWCKITAANLRDFFTCGSFGDRQEFRAAIFDHAITLAKQRIGSSARVCFIGDTPDDIQAARSVRAQIVAVSSGSFPFDQLAAFNPDACYRSCAEFLAGREQARRVEDFLARP
jgi:phosphoglycolate phosphatase